MKTKTQITEISKEDIIDLISTATYGSGWFGVSYDSPTYLGLIDADKEDSFEDKVAKLLIAGYAVEFIDYSAEDKEDFYGKVQHKWDSEDRCMVYTVCLDDIKNGLQKAFDSDTPWERECINSLVIDDGINLDLPRAEALCQMIMFGEVIYG